MRNRPLVSLLAVLMLLGLACNPLQGTQPNIGATATAIARSIFATQTAEAPTQTPIIIVVTATPEPSATPTETPQEIEPSPSPTWEATDTPEPETPTATPTTLAKKTAAPTKAVSSKTSSKGLLAFTKSANGEVHTLWIANLDGSGQKFILDHAAGPSWSPDGTRLSFYGEEGVDRQKDANGSNLVFEGASNGLLAISPIGVPVEQAKLHQFVKEGTARWTAWAPSGDMMAYDATPGGINRRIYFLGTADNRQFSIEIPGEQADWSPDSTKITYRSCRQNQCGLWVSNRDDSGAHRVTEAGDDAFPRWSPKGDKIAFSRKEGDTADVYVMDVDGSNVKRLTTDPAHDTLPTWTRDGLQIVFKSARSGSWSIWIMSADGSNQREIIKGVGMGKDWAFDRMDVSGSGGAAVTVPTSKPTTTTKPAAPTATKTSGSIPAGKGVLRVINTTNGEVTFTVADQAYKIPSGKFQDITLDPGHYTYSADMPDGRRGDGELDIKLGGTLRLTLSG